MDPMFGLALFAVAMVSVCVAGLAVLRFVVRPRQEAKAKQDALIPYALCPKCGSDEARPVRYTWWGGAVGPNLLTHVKCASCGATYNGKTGKPNTPAIVVYSIVAIVIGYWLFAVISRLLVVIR